MKKIPDFYIWVAAVWLVDIAASIVTASGYLFRPSSPVSLKLLLIASHYSAWFLLGFLAVFVFYFIKPHIESIGLIRKIAQILTIFLGWMGTFVFLISWIVYKRTSNFVDFEGLNFLRVNPMHLFQHVLQVEEAALIKAVLGSCVLFVTLCAIVQWLCSVLKLRARMYVAGTGIIFLILGIGSPFLVKAADAERPVAILDTVENVYFSRSELLDYLQVYHVSPAARLLAGMFRHIRTSKEKEFISTPYPEQKRIVPMEAYLSRVDQKKLHKYNVVQIIVESLRADRLKKNGAKREVMPYLDALAERSVFFKNASAQSTHSDYADLCILNAQYPLRSRIHHYYGNDAYPRLLIYDVLKGIGYRTSIFSSQNENWGGMLNYLQTPALDTLFHAETFKGETYFGKMDTGLSTKIQMGELTAGKIEDSVTIREAAKWIHKNKESPFFISINLQNSHFPYLIPEEDKAAFKPVEITFPVSFVFYPKEQTYIVENRYDSSLHYMDEQIQTLLDALKGMNLLENTIIVVTGDSGEAFYEHGRVTHAAELWDEVLQVPLFFYVPNTEPRDLKYPVEHVDIPPTLLSLIGLPPHSSFQGKNIFGEDAARNPTSYYVVQTGLADQIAIRAGSYKLILDRRINRYRLFDVEHDPQEMINLVDKKRDVFLEMSERLDRWQFEQLEYYENEDLYTQYYPRNYD